MVWELLASTKTTYQLESLSLKYGDPAYARDYIVAGITYWDESAWRVSGGDVAFTNTKLTVFDFSKYRYRFYLSSRKAETLVTLENKPSAGETFLNVKFTRVPEKTDQSFVIERELKNSTPSLTLAVENNRTLYENDTLTIEGSAADVDNGNIVNVRYQLNAGTIRALQTGISDGRTPIAFNKKLTAKGGILYDGATAITSALAEGVAHTLKVWAEDDQGGKSTEITRTFYVVPNRPPSVTVDAFTQKDGLINVDTVTISGTASDPDGNDVTVKYRLNDGPSVQVYNGAPGAYSFDLTLSALKDGANKIVVEVTDIYSFKASKTITLNKNAVLTPLATSVQRYEIVPPTGSAQGVLLWIQRDNNVTVSADISMTIGAEQEQYVPMSLTNTAPVIGTTVEDEFTYQADTPKENIVVKLTLTGEGSVSLISGVLS